MFRTVEMPMQDLAELIREQISHGGTAVIMARGYSMMPMLHHERSSIWLKKPETGLKCGDVILYRRPEGRYVMHRIVKKQGADSFLCCGDNCCETEWVSGDHVLAVVSAFTRKGQQHTVEELPYRIYTWGMLRSMPFRKQILWFRRRIGRWMHGKRRRRRE